MSAAVAPRATDSAQGELIRHGPAVGLVISGIIAAACLGLAANADAKYTLPLVVGSVLACTIGALAQARRSRIGLLSPFPVFVIGASLYVLPTAITLQVAAAITDYRLFLAETMIQATYVAAAAQLGVLVGFAATFLLHRTPKNPRRGFTVPWDEGFLPAAATIIAIIGFMGVASWVIRVGGISQLSALSYGNRYLVAQGQGIALSGIQWMSVAGFTLYLCSLRSPRTRLLRVMVLGIVALLFVWTIVIGSRGALVQTFMGLAVLKQTSDRPLSTTRLVILGGIVALAAMVFGVVGRSFTAVNFRAVSAVPLTALNPANAEFGSGIGTIADMIRSVPNEEPFRWGSTYVTEFAVLVPRVLWPNRPLSLSEWYAARFYPEVWSEGGAFSFSPVAEAYLNFGFAGVICVFGFMGILLSSAERRLSTYLALPPWTAVVYATIVPFMLLFSRLYVMAVIKAALVWLVPVVMTYVVARVLRLAMATPVARARPA